MDGFRMYFPHESDLAESDSWPVSLDQLGTLVTIMVRSNDPSTNLAMRVAHELVEKFSGLITWDGIHYWEALYNAWPRKIGDVM